MFGQAGGEDPTLASNLFQEIVAFGRIPRRSKDAHEDENTLAEKLKKIRRNHNFSAEQEEELQRLQRLQDQGGESVSMSRSRGGIQDPIGVLLPRSPSENNHANRQ